MTLTKYILVGALLAFPAMGQAFDSSKLRLLEPEHVSVEYYDYQALASLRGRQTPSYRDTYLSPLDKEIKFGLGLNVDYNLVQYEDYRLAWENYYFFDSTPTHVRHVGWQFFLGVHIHEKVAVGYRHMSRHVLEAERKGKFPVYDAIQVRFTIYDK